MNVGSTVEPIFSALSDKTRRSVVDLLCEKPHRAGELSSALGIDPASLSRHLRVLRKAGIVSGDHPENDARVRLYRLRPEAFLGLRKWLDEIEAFWNVQLEAFAEHMEQKP